MTTEKLSMIFVFRSSVAPLFAHIPHKIIPIILVHHVLFFCKFGKRIDIQEKDSKDLYLRQITDRKQNIRHFCSFDWDLKCYNDEIANFYERNRYNNPHFVFFRLNIS